VFDSELNNWRRRKNNEQREITVGALLTSHIKCQRLKWFGHTMRKKETTNTRAVMEWQSTGKKPRGRSRKLWMDGIRKDLETLEVTNWEDEVQDSDYWRTVTVVAKILKEL